MTKNTLEHLETMRNKIRRERDRLEVILMDDVDMDRPRRELICDWRDEFEKILEQVCRMIHNQKNLP